MNRLLERGTNRGFVVLLLALVLAGLGALFVPATWAMWLVVAAVLVLVVQLAIVHINGSWWPWLAWMAGAVAMVGLGGAFLPATGAGLVEAGRMARSLEFVHPEWLLLLVLIPVVIRLSYRSLAGLGPVRRWVALGLRCTLILLLTLALAEPRLRRPSEDMTTLFLIDRSLSVPEEVISDTRPGIPRVDRRWERIKHFVNDAVAARGKAAGHERDRAGVILFGRKPRVELPASDAPLLNFGEIATPVDGNYTDIASAIKLALASFPEDTGKRVVLISDGNENLGDALQQAELARQNGVQIDVVPLAAGQRNASEVLVQSVEAPSLVEQGSQLPIRILVRSSNPNLVVGTLSVKQIAEGIGIDVPGSPRKNVVLYPGLNSVLFKQPLGDQQRSYTYEAEFQPEWVQTEKAVLVDRGLPGDRVQNNRATTHVVARGQRRLLLIEPRDGEHQALVEKLAAAGKSKFEVNTITVEKLPPDRDKLTVLLSNYDCVILANVAAADVAADVGGNNEPVAGSISEVQQEVLRSNTHDQGCGLIMIGGPNGFGAGGWQGTPIEKALPVDCEIKSLEVQGKGGLVLVMHASEMADGNRWQKVIAKLAVDKLSSADEVGVLQYDYTTGTVRWHIPLQEIGERRGALKAMIDRLVPGDMPDFDPALRLAHDHLIDPKRELVTKHTIIISDGDPMQQDKTILARMRNNRVTCSTVGVATHGAPQDQSLAAIAQATRGRFYNVKNPNALPQIYTKETRLVSQSFLYEKRFQPRALPQFYAGPTEGLDAKLEPLYGFVRTTAKPSLLVQVPIVSPPLAGQEFPILAYWHYGLGKSVAFTSDAKTNPGRLAWDRDWFEAPQYAKFWEQVIDWALRPVESRRLTMTTEQRDGKVRVIVDARDDKNRPLINLTLRGGVTTPAGKTGDEKQVELRFEQKNSGVYEAEIKAEEAGSYFVNAQAVRRVEVKGKDGQLHTVEEGVDSVRGGITIPYSPEFSDLESNTTLLERLRERTGGLAYADDDEALAGAASSLQVFRPGPPRFRTLQPIWYWLVFLTGVLLFCDVAVRRIAIEPGEVVTAAQAYWERLRGRAVATQREEYFERLRSRKAQVGETLEKDKAARRFEGSDAPVSPPTATALPTAAPSPPPKPAPPLPIAPTKEQAEDYASRLMRAKKKALGEREKPKEE